MIKVVLALQSLLALYTCGLTGTLLAVFELEATSGCDW